MIATIHNFSVLGREMVLFYRVNIHKNVDVLKTTGIGPGISFAEEMLLLQV